MSLWLGLFPAALAAPPELGDEGAESPPPVLATLSPLEELQATVERVIAVAEPSVVSIATIRPDPAGQIGVDLDPGSLPLDMQARMGDARQPDYLPGNFGAGIVVSPAGGRNRYVLTSYHVVRGGPVSGRPSPADGTRLELNFASRRSCSATIRAADPRSDLAVLEPNWQELGAAASTVPVLVWRDVPAVRKGQFVITLGNPYYIARDGSASAAWGIVSNTLRRPIAPSLREVQEGTWLADLRSLIQLDTRINLGGSGGPVLNLKGEVVGLASSLAAVESHDRAGGLALPFTSGTQRIIAELLAGHEAEYGLLGVAGFTDLTPGQIDREYRIPSRPAGAVQIGDVPHNSPSELAGLERGDVVLNVGGAPILCVADLMREVGLRGPGVDVGVTVWRPRERQELTLRVKLAKWPVVDDSGIVETVPRYAPWRGLRVDYAMARKRWQPTVGGILRGVLITEVQPGSPADEAQLEPGQHITHVNGTVVSTPADFHAAVRSAAAGASLKLSDGRAVTVAD